MLYRRYVAAVFLVVGLLGGCSPSTDAGGPLPDGPALVTASAKALAGLRSVRFTLGVSGDVPGLPIRQVQGDATLDGTPQGTAMGRADVQETVNRFQLDYVLDGNKVYVTEKDGKHQEFPASPEFTPAALLGPDRGLNRLLSNATDLKTEIEEKLNGVETYRVGGKLSKAVISSVVPGIQSDVDVKFWVEQAATRRLTRVWIQIPPIKPNEGAIMLELALSNFNVPVTIPPPG